MSSTVIGIIGFAVVLLLILFVKFPIGFSMILVGVIGIAYLTSI